MSTFNAFQQPVGDEVIDWQPRQPPARIVLRGHYCRLEPLHPRHAGALFAAYQQAPDARSWTWLLREPDASAADYTHWVESVSALSDPVHFAVIDSQTDTPVGTLALMRIDPANGVIEVGHVHFSPLMSRTRMSTEAQYLLMRYVFEDLGYRRYEWKCDSLNEPSRRAALRLGFQYEGRFRQALVTKGRNRDTDWFSVIDKEWPTLKNAFRRWLASDNFTADGKQLRSLEKWRETRC